MADEQIQTWKKLSTQFNENDNNKDNYYCKMPCDIIQYNWMQCDTKLENTLLQSEIEYSTIVEIKIQHDTIQNNAIP